MRVIFVRHGHYDKKGLTPTQQKHQPLNDAGVLVARAAGEFLRQRGERPDLVFTTKAERTLHTARLVLEELGMQDATIEPRNGGPTAAKASLDKKLTTWLAGREPAVVMFVGHEKTQSYLAGLVGVKQPPTDHKAAVLILQREQGSWRFVCCFEGKPK